VVDLFGRPIYESAPARQLELYPDWHWFYLGYQDAWHGQPLSRRHLMRERPAYGYGYQVGRRDRQDDDRDSNCNADRAWAQARAVGNVEG
jgi:hypothetical protein